MKKGLKTILIVAVSAVVIGLVLSLVAFAAVGFDVRRLNGTDIVTDNYSFGITDFDSISIESDITDVKIFRSDTAGDSVLVTVRQDKKLRHSVSVSDGTLRISSGDRPWYHSIGIFFGEQVIEITVPSDFALDLISVETDTGDVDIRDVSARSVKVASDTGDLAVRSSDVTNLTAELDTGDVEIYKLTASLLSIETDTGDVDMKDTVATDKITVKSDTGDVELESCDSFELYIESDTGDVELSLLTAKSFDADSVTGRVSVPSSSTGGPCKIRTTTGDIEARIK